MATTKRVTSHMKLLWCSTSALLAAGTLLVGGSPATANAIDDDGLWYFDRFKVQAAHDEGITGKGVTIAMIDSPVYLDLPTLADADVRVQDAPCVRADGTRPAGVSDNFDDAGHGTAVLSLLVGSGAGYPGQTGVKGLAPDATVLTYHAQYFEEDDPDWDCSGTQMRPGPNAYEDLRPRSPNDELALAMHQAMDAGADIISISLAGAGTGSISDALARAVREEVIVVAGQPNEDQMWAGNSPGSDNGVVTVNSARPDGTAHTKDHTDVAAPGYDILVQGGSQSWERQMITKGTSLATPIVAGNLALAMQKYPAATPNQLLQSLIHNTGAEPHELAWEPTFGYGIVITDVFLAADPTIYPDVNPFVHNFDRLYPAVDHIWEWATPERDADVIDAPQPWTIYTPEPSPPSNSPTTDDGPALDASPAPSTAQAEPDDPADTGLGSYVPAIIIGVVLLIAIAVIIAITVIRSNRSAGGHHGTE